MKIAVRSHSIRDELRVCTRAAHEKLHEHSLFVELFDGSVSLERYSALMQSFHGFYTPMERGVDRALSEITPGGISFSYTKRANLLTQDLRDLGYNARHIDQNPTCETIYDVVTPQSLAGVLYVIEGSILGAAKIDRAAHRLLKSDTPDGRRFWAWSRANNTSRWAMINAYLAQRETSDHNLDAIIQGANDTFQALADWLAPLDQPKVMSESAVS
ncbi:MAG: biliverdin-producing heme oxygenase [Roseobacter sp.]